MRNTTRTLLFLLIGLLFFHAFADKPKAKMVKKAKPKPTALRQPAPEFPYVGDIVYLQGSVQAQRAQAPSWIPAYVNMPDYLLDKIKTDPQSTTTLEFSNGTQVSINKDTEVEIDTETSLRDITQRTLLKRIKLTLGTVWCKVTRQEAGESFTVETRGGVLGVRGTEFVVSSKGGDETDIYVLEGTVVAGADASHLNQAIAAGQEAKLKAGQVILLGVLHTAVNALFHPPYGTASLVFGAIEGQDVGTIAMNMAIDEAVSHVPYGSEIRGIVGLFGGPARPSDLKPHGEVRTYTPTFSWNGIGEAKSYSIIISKSPFREKMSKEEMVWTSRVNGTSVTYPETAPFLMPNTTYFWAVVGLDDHGKVVGAGSEPGAFVLAGEDVLGKRDLSPQPLHPSDEAVPDQLPTFSWNAMKGAANYAVLIGTEMKEGRLPQERLVSVVKTGNGEKEIQYSVKDRPLQPGKTYYWSVMALDDQGKGFGLPSAPLSFTLPEPAKAGPRPLFPLNAARDPFHFEWRAWASGISGYRVRVSEGADLSKPLYTWESKTPWLDVEGGLSKLVPGKTYYWNVSTVLLDGKEGIAGPTASFQLAP